MATRMELIQALGMGNAFRFLYLIMDKSGNIKEVYAHPRYSSIRDELLSTGSIEPFFPWSQYKSECLEKGKVAGRSISNFRYFAEERNFYTVLPLTYFTCEKEDFDTIFVQCSFHEIIPNIFTDRHTHFIYVDAERMTLKGFNRFFFELLKKRFNSPAELLDKELSAIFDSFPHSREKTTQYSTGKEELLYASKEIKITADRKLAYYPIPGYVNSSGGSIGARLTTLINAAPTYTTLPLLFFGEPACDGIHTPDTKGYLAGSAIDNKRWIIKRRGYVVADAPMKDYETIRNLSLLIAGDTLAFNVNDETVLHYADSDMLLTDQIFATVGARPSCTISIDAISFTSVETGIAAKAPRHSPEAELTASDGKHYFSLERFFNDSVTDSPFFYYPYAGYFLNDITELRGRVNLLENEVRRFEPLASDQKIIGSSASAVRIREWAERVATTDATILVEGATGTGKEVVARSIHNMSNRTKEPFIKIDCSTIPESLMESHLFGHEKGAFTGADSRYIGIFERAGNGTIFLDEISNLSMTVQAKLLLTLNDFTITRLGGREPIKLKARIIAASNHNLSNLIKRGLFRSDLYYRLSVFQISLPGLNDRIDDLSGLCDHFLAFFNLVYKKNITGISNSAIKKLKQHIWKGNIRELRNCIEQTVLLCGSERIDAEHILFRTEGNGGLSFNRKRAKEVSDTKMIKTDPDRIVSLLRKRNGRVAAIARELGTSPGALYYFLRKNKIDPEEFRHGF